MHDVLIVGGGPVGLSCRARRSTAEGCSPSRKTRTFAVSLTMIVATGLATPTITNTQADASAEVRSPYATSESNTSGAQGEHRDARCYGVRVPVSVARVGKAHVYGELCQPRRGDKTSRIVQLLVPGSTYNHSYFDMPVRRSHYSYVARALDAGHSTFNIDRLATGRSTLPPSSLYTLDAGVQAIHQVITKLRAGDIGHRRFTRVVWVGHSLGSSMAWAEAQQYQDVDAFVLTGMSHVVRQERPSTGHGEEIPFEIKAKDDPKFRGTVSDPGYLTTNAGMRRFFYHEPNADPAVIEADERLKDLSTAADSTGPTLPPEQSPSRSIKVPTLIVVGDQDPYCTTGVCTPESMLAHERSYYSDTADLKAIVVSDSGHSVQLHKNAPRTNAAILQWIATVVS
ncbi:alpha/beta fold hydrolase [Saccharothrix tamanrassetensis]|uniref:alpha/beta fold hydrolase n=1 Tax=Saccharothrix tamanrassetensis TaxID=1051531 RepID=UPI00162305E9|nr:alpha/beta hydrolase [Saccharothrix tamanrassetensis]